MDGKSIDERLERIATAQGRLAEWSDLSLSGDPLPDAYINGGIALAMALAVSLGNPSEIARVAKIANERSKSFDAEQANAFFESVLTKAASVLPSKYYAILVTALRGDDEG